MYSRELTGSAFGISSALLIVAAASCGGGGDNSTGSSSSGMAGGTASTGSGGSGSSTTSSSTSTAGSGSSSSASGAGGAGEPSDVTGTSVGDHIAEVGTKQTADDLSAAVVEALVPKGPGEWTKIPGKGTADGSFTIPSVPAGSFLLHVNTTYIDSSARVFDLGADTIGRPNKVPVTVTPTTLTNSILNVNPWQATDYIEWFVGNSGAYTSSLTQDSFSTAPPVPGSTSLLGVPIDWSAAVLSGVIDNNEGDILTIGHLISLVGPGSLKYNVVRGFMSVNDVFQTDGKEMPIKGAFNEVPQSQSVAINLQTPKFEGYLGKVNPATAAFETSLAIGTSPGAGAHGPLETYVNLLSFKIGPTPDEANLGVMKYGNPYPDAWGTFALVAATGEVSYTAKGATSAFKARGGLSVSSDVATLGSGPIQPTLSPVESAKVNGADAFGALSGITTTPTLSWTAPSVGTPSYYRVSVFELTASSGNTQSKNVAVLYTAGTSLPIPDGVLNIGGSYYFQIVAVKTPSDVTHPNRLSVSRATASVLTSVATP